MSETPQQADPLAQLLDRQAELLALLDRPERLETDRLLATWQRCEAASDALQADPRFSAEALERARHLNGLLRARLSTLAGHLGQELERVRAARGSLESQRTSRAGGDHLDVRG